MIPVITKAAEIIGDSFRQYPRNIPGKHDIRGTTKKQPYCALHSYFGKY